MPVISLLFKKTNREHKSFQAFGGRNSRALFYEPAFALNGFMGNGARGQSRLQVPLSVEPTLSRLPEGVCGTRRAFAKRESAAGADDKGENYI